MPGGRTLRASFFAILLVVMLLPPGLVGHPAFASSDTQTNQQRTDGELLVPGTLAIVRGDGDCLRVRDTPGLSGTRIDCIPDGGVLTVLPNTVEVDGYRWQFISYRQITGWVADEFLEPYFGPPPTDGCSAASTIQPGFTGAAPAGGGLGLVVWGGGTTGGVETLAMSQGCQLRAVWGNSPSGGLIGYTFGAPDFVNRNWLAAFPGGSISAGTPLLLVCQPPGSTIASISSVPLPAPTRSAPRYIGSTPAPEIDARGAVIIDEASGAVLYDHNAYEAVPPASLTKIVTAVIALEAADPESWVHVADVDYRQMPGSSVVGLVPGDCFRLRDLVYGLMLPSGNDAALAIARYQAGSDANFIHLMNTLVSRIGLSSSHFTDPHGLGSPEHVMSAYDVAMVSRYAMTLPMFREVVAARSWTASGDRDLSMLNVNSFLSRYAGGDGVKTGFTEEAGRTLSASATRDGHRLYVVLLNADDRYGDAQALLDWAFENHAWE